MDMYWEWANCARLITKKQSVNMTTNDKETANGCGDAPLQLLMGRYIALSSASV